ncbi:RNA polymerase sigma-70 factor [Nonomuraea sp. NPDC050310]|uniref:RNA polymerase sigma-70 factor n=1 Tax=unclassified Nonomuraea TaxID=2593643 RepID=UPI0033C39427
MEFEELRPLLLGIAYRLLGSMWDAEDVVQDAWLRWQSVDREEVREPRAFLTTVVSRLALDQLRSARVRRESYTGPWLPEPVATGQIGPLDTAELRDTVSFATLHLMEQLTPPERAVFVLREAFEFPYDQIAGIVETSVANCRQLHRRAATRLEEERGGRFSPSEEEHAKLLAEFLRAAGEGDLDALTGFLHEEITSWNDGGGKVRSALRPVTGRANVAAFLAGLVRRYELGEVRPVQVNGETGFLVDMGERQQVVTVSMRDGLIHDLYVVANPDKLTRVL